MDSTDMPLDTRFLEHYHQLLESRARAYPSRQYAEKTELLSQYDKLVAELIHLAETGDWLPLPDHQPFSLDNAVFIGGFPKSGTTMIPALLDSHPALLVIPGDAQYLDIKRNFQNRPLSQIITRLRRYMMTMVIHPLGLHPFWLLSHQEPAYEPYAQLFSYFADALQDAPPTFDGTWAAMLRALRAITESQANIWVEKTPSNEYNAHTLSQHFPKAKFIHVIRHPAANLASLKKMVEVGAEWDVMAYQAAYLRRSMKLAQGNQAALGKNRYLIVRYEDLTDDTERHMQQVADFLGIPFDESLTQATVFGLPATPNSSYKERQRRDGAPLKSHEAWREVLSDWELDLIAFLLRNTLSGYTLPVQAGIREYWGAIRQSNQHGKRIKLYRAVRYFLESYR
jgi:Sulfotransferase family